MVVRLPCRAAMLSETKKRKCKAELAALSVAERGVKKEKRARFKGSLFLVVHF